ncbi:zinc ribbon domain-containing protein [Candidatus Micrarchaeota archaeon]|nr:zinc ribbon domain-containing protein [Candidatus Micrarchaeota archaeon]
MVKKCESCGMPMEKPEDFGGRNKENKYCTHCTDKNGILKSYSDVLEGMAAFIVKTENLSSEEARKKAEAYMKTMPAWRERG